MHRISLSGVTDLITVLPFHLGFHPRNSLVVTCLEGRRLGLVARLDLVPAEQAPGVVAGLEAALRSAGATEAVLVAFEDEPGASAALGDMVAELLARREVVLVDRVEVRAGRWFRPGCSCCPVEGRVLPQPQDVPAVADFVGLGQVPLPDRQALACLVEPRGDARVLREDLAEYAQELESVRSDGAAPDGPGRAAQMLERSLRAWGLHLRAPACEPLEAEDVIALAGCLREPDVRDGIIAALCPGTLSPAAFDDALVEGLRRHVGAWSGDAPTGDAAEEAQARRVQARLEALCRALPAAEAAPALAVAGAYAWHRGDGARAAVALEAALDLEPGHRLSQLLDHMVRLGVRPDGAAGATAGRSTTRTA